MMVLSDEVPLENVKWSRASHLGLARVVFETCLQTPNPEAETTMMEANAV